MNSIIEGMGNMTICPKYKAALIIGLAGKYENFVMEGGVFKQKYGDVDYREFLECDQAGCEWWNDKTEECGVKAPSPYNPGQ